MSKKRGLRFTTALLLIIDLVLAGYIFYSYLDQTGTGASYYEVIYDRTIVFHRKTAENQ